MRVAWAGVGAGEDLAALFVRSCLPFAGQPASLRQWAARTGLPEIPDPARTQFLVGAAGKVFDASTVMGKLVLLSGDDGVCAVIAGRAGDVETVNGLETALKAMGVTPRLMVERNDKYNPALHHREYFATGKTRSWRILAATVREAQGGEGRGGEGRAMLTAAPE